MTQIYICAGYAKYFYSVDVLNWICLDRLWITGSDPGFQFRQFKVVEDRINQLFLPFTCTMKLCDLVQDDILVDPIADYLAKKAITYGTEPFLLKHAQDLEMFMIRRIDSPLVKSHPNIYITYPCLIIDIIKDQDIWNNLIRDSLELIEKFHVLLGDLQRSGKLVSKYHHRIQITKYSIKKTRIVDTLEATALADWGKDADKIQEYAATIADDFITICNTMASEPEEHDEYFEHDDYFECDESFGQESRRILFSQI
ncbi:hypothetical protein Clacol_008749 [Clathrus columnatus]|uniref:Uncharacterized protein n=1 Tax=Clathrus columnatus TaxID=1419009 RepID=A0AAV5ARH4_9AGAM|nr:hypothetical protein Clacol_008749 [Clathrus columnatus]